MADIFERILEGQDASSSGLIDKGVLTHACDRISLEVIDFAQDRFSLMLFVD